MGIVRRPTHTCYTLLLLNMFAYYYTYNIVMFTHISLISKVMGHIISDVFQLAEKKEAAVKRKSAATETESPAEKTAPEKKAKVAEAAEPEEAAA